MPLPWREQHAFKIEKAATALESLERGNNVFLGSGAAEPILLTEALGHLAKDWDREAIHTYGFRPSLQVADPAAKRFRHTVFGAGSQGALDLRPGEVELMPVPSWRIASLLGRDLPIDVALVVRDDYQRQGIGSWLLVYTGEVARRRGIRGLGADILVGNQRGLGLVNKVEVDVQTMLKDGYYSVYYAFPQEG